MEPFKRMDHMVFNVKDLDAAVEFYEKVVGMKVVMRFEDRRMAFMSFGERMGDIRLFEEGEQYTDDRHWHGFNHVAFLPEGGKPALDKLHDRLKEMSVDVESIETFAGGKHTGIYFRDPDNNRLEFYWETPEWVAECRSKVARAYDRVDSVDPEGPAFDLYTWPTPNGMRPAIMLKLLKLDYKLLPVPLGPKAGEKPEGFAEISPMGKLPALRDNQTGTTTSESCAILIYLAEKMRSELLPMAGPERTAVLQWLFTIASTFAPPMSEGRFYLHVNKDKAPLAEERVSGQIVRSYKTAESQLARTAYIAGETLSIADIALWPYVSRHEWQGIDLGAFPHTLAWYKKLAEIDAFKAGFDLLGKGEVPPLTA